MNPIWFRADKKSCRREVMSRTVDALMKFCLSAVVLEVRLGDVHLRNTAFGLLGLLLWIGELPQSHMPGHLS
jgi:hypothetical protein